MFADYVWFPFTHATIWLITHPLEVCLSACVVIGVVWAAGYRHL